MMRGSVTGQIRPWPPSRLRAELARAVARTGDLLITGRLGAGRHRAALHAKDLLAESGCSTDVVPLFQPPDELPAGRCIFVGGPGLRPGDLVGRRVVHVAVHPWTLEEIRGAFGSVEDEVLLRLHAATAGHYVYLDAWDAAGRPSDLTDPQIWQSAVDRAFAALSRPAEALCGELACGFRVLDVPVAPSLSDPTDDPSLLMGELDGAALLTERGELVPVAVTALERRLAPYRRHLLRREFLRQLRDPAPHEATLLRWAETGLNDASLPGHLVALADQVRWREPQRALRLYEAAGPAEDLEAQRLAGIAETALLLGDTARARDAAEDALALDTGPSLARALRVLEEIWQGKGLARLAAELNGRYAQSGSLVQCARWFVTHLRVGDRTAALARWDERASTIPRTIDEVACVALVEALDASVTPDRSQADDSVIERLTDLAHELSLECRVTTGWTTVVTALALAAGRASAAAKMLTALSETPDFTAEHRILLGWAELRSGRRARAASLLEGARVECLTPRGECLAAGLALALALHTNDRNALAASWPAAVAAIGQCEPDLFGLVAHADLMVAAARLRDKAAIQQIRAATHTLLGRLGHPAVWSNLIDWGQIQGAILTEQPDEIREPAERLRDSSSHSVQAAILARAGRVWIDVLARRFDPQEVLSAARSLAQAGVAMDGARLAAHAAARCDDDVVRRDLLEMARLTHETTLEAGRQHVSASSSSLHLSAREVQVASLVIQHRSYREIGETLFLSPRTVENHVARIRRRAGARTRRELLDQLRETLRDLGRLG